MTLAPSIATAQAHEPGEPHFGRPNRQPGQPGQPNGEPKNQPKGPGWTAQDSLAAASIVDVLRRRPESIDSLTAGSLTRDHNLGFGRRLREAWLNPAGKLGFAFKIFYEGARAVAFEARPIINYAGVRARCLPILAPLFNPLPAGGNGGSGAFQPYHWNLDEASRPLPAPTLKLLQEPLPSQSIRDALAYYMSPYSGTLYGIRGGDAGQLLQNRDVFLGLSEILMADQKLARYLLRSVNPASRLTAAEFILRRKEDFPGFDSLQATTFRVVFANPPKAASLRGSLETSEDPRKLVYECAGQEVRRDGRGVLRMY
ncbi:MAG: hypothetical protein ABIW76_17460 [Fibrobacteria bacterium]